MLAAPLALWVLLAVPVKHLADDDSAWELSGTAMLLCLVPALLTYVVAERFIRHDPQQGPIILLGAAGVRMFGVLCVALILFANFPLFAQGRFLVWLLVFYFF